MNEGMIEMAKKIHEATGYEGRELEMATYMVMMFHADLVGQGAIGQYFERKMQESYLKKVGAI